MYKLFKPDLKLTAYVDFYWESNFMSYYEELYVAQFHANIIFNIDGEYKRNGSEINFSSLEVINTKPILFEHTCSNRIFGVRLKQYALPLFFNIGAEELMNEQVVLKDIWLQEADGLTEQLHFCENSEERVNLINAFLIEKLNASLIEKVSVCKKALELLQQNLDNTKPINTIANSLNLTHRTLDRTFIRFLGLTPIKLLRLVRFNSFYDALHLQNHENVNCFDYGYYDQSHFIKEFKNFSGYTPSAYLSTNHFVQNLQDKHKLLG